MDEFNAIFADSTSRNLYEPQILPGRMRPEHVLLMGANSPEKQSLHWDLITQDIEAGAGVAVIDATGKVAPKLLNQVPTERLQTTWWFAPANQQRSFGLNPIQGVQAEARSRAAQELMELFSAIWDLSYERTPLLLDILRFTTRVLLDCQHASMLSMYQVLTDWNYRRRMVEQCEDPLTRRFWQNFEERSAREQREAMHSTLTRLHTFLADPILRNSLSQTKAALDLERVVREGQVLLADVSSRKLGGEAAMLFGSLLAYRLHVAMQLDSAKPFFVHIIESPHVTRTLLARLMTTDYGKHGIVGAVDQISGDPAGVRAGLLQAGTLLTTRVSADDTRYLAPRFNLANVDTELQTLASNQVAASSSSYTLQLMPRQMKRVGRGSDIKRRSRRVLSVSQDRVAAKVQRFLDPLRRKEGLKGDEIEHLEGFWS